MGSFTTTSPRGRSQITQDEPSAHAAYGARLIRRDLAATAALFARSIDRHLAKHDLKTSRGAPVTSKGDHAE